MWISHLPIGIQYFFDAEDRERLPSTTSNIHLLNVSSIYFNFFWQSFTTQIVCAVCILQIWNLLYVPYEAYWWDHNNNEPEPCVLIFWSCILIFWSTDQQWTDETNNQWTRTVFWSTEQQWANELLLSDNYHISERILQSISYGIQRAVHHRLTVSGWYIKGNTYTYLEYEFDIFSLGNHEQ